MKHAGCGEPGFKGGCVTDDSVVGIVVVVGSIVFLLAVGRMLVSFFKIKQGQGNTYGERKGVINFKSVPVIKVGVAYKTTGFDLSGVRGHAIQFTPLRRLRMFETWGTILLVVFVCGGVAIDITESTVELRPLTSIFLIPSCLLGGLFGYWCGGRWACKAAMQKQAHKDRGANEKVLGLRCVRLRDWDRWIAQLTKAAATNSAPQVQELPDAWRTGYVSATGEVISLGDSRPGGILAGQWAQVEFLIGSDAAGYLMFTQCEISDAASGKTCSLSSVQKHAMVKYLSSAWAWELHWQRAPESVKSLFASETPRACGDQHDWDGCICKRCGQTRAHEWGPLEEHDFSGLGVFDSRGTVKRIVGRTCIHCRKGL
jgi:hypothetical protein